VTGATVIVDNLRVVARAGHGGETPIVKDVSFRIEPGEVLALIGESGSGKTTIALSLLGYARHGCRIAGGTIRIGETDVLSLTEAERRQLRGRRVAYIAQSAAASFNPSRTVMDQVVETARIHSLMPREEAERKAVALFRELALPSPDTIGQRYPHQVSGGQLQRLMAAMALMSDPDLVILDEPTTALDVTTQIEVLHAFRRVVREHKTTAVYVTHDLAVVAQMADRILVLRDGAQREIGATPQIIGAPQDEYTRSLIAAATPRARPADTAPKGETPLLEIRQLVAGYGAIGKNGRPAAPVLDDVSLRLSRGQAVGVIGESGSGKTTLARVVAGLVAPAAGQVLFDGRPLPAGGVSMVPPMVASPSARMSTKALRSSVRASALRMRGSSKGGASLLTIRLVLTPVARMVHCACGASRLMFLSSGTVTSVGKVMSNLPLMNDSMRVERSGMMVNSMPSR